MGERHKEMGPCSKKLHTYPVASRAYCFSMVMALPPFYLYLNTHILAISQYFNNQHRIVSYPCRLEYLYAFIIADLHYCSTSWLLACLHTYILTCIHALHTYLHTCILSKCKSYI